MAQKLPTALKAKVNSFLTISESSSESYKLHFWPDWKHGQNTHVLSLGFQQDSADEGKEVDFCAFCTGAEKRRLTVVLSAAADGRMLPAMVIFKGKRMP